MKRTTSSRKRSIILYTILFAFCLLLAGGILRLWKPGHEIRSYERFLHREYRKVADLIPQDSSQIPKQDRPDLAAWHEYISTMDPELRSVPLGRLEKARVETRQAWKKSRAKNAADALQWSAYSSDHGGRTRCLMFDPNDADNKKVWAGAVTGGLWYNEDITNASSPWVAVGDFWDNLSVSSLAWDPNDTDIFYAGTGEASTAVIIYRESSGRGSGIWKTEDGGASWAQIPGTEGFLYVTDLAVRDEGGLSVLYACVVSGKYKGSDHQSQPTDGLYRSEDGGESWTQVLPDIPGTSVPFAPSDIAIAADGRIFVGTGRNLQGKGAATILYSDSGTAGSWTAIHQYREDIAAAPFYNYPGRVMMAPAPSDPSIVYALVSSGYVRNDGYIGYYCRHILRSLDAGNTWTTLPLPNENESWATLAWHALTAAVDPQDPAHLLIGGLDLYQCRNALDQLPEWQQISSWWSSVSDIPGNQYVHADQHAIIYRPGHPREVAFTNDGGVFFTDDIRAEWPSFEEHNKDFNTLQFYTGAIHPRAGNDYYIGGLQDNGTLLYRDNGSYYNDFIFGGDGSYCFIDETEPSYMIVSVYYNWYNFIYNTTDYSGTEYREYYGTGIFINPADYDPRYNTLFANGMNVKGQYRDKLLVIKKIPHYPMGSLKSANTGSSVPFSHIHFSRHSPGGSSTLFAGTQSGRLYRIANAQHRPEATEITGAGFPAGNISCIDVGLSEDTLMTTFSNYGVSSVWLSTNGGATWSDKQGNLPDMPVRWCLFQPQDASTVLLATETGVWTTRNFLDDEVDWQPDVQGMANVRTDMLRLRRSDNTVLAATHGRGLYTTTLESPDRPAEGEEPEITLFPNPSRGQVNLTFFCTTPGNMEIWVTNMSGRIVHSEATYCMTGTVTKTLDLTTVGSGMYLVKLVIGGKEILRRVVIH